MGKVTKHPGGQTADGKHTIDMEEEGGELYLLVDGTRIARRGLPSTKQAGKWVSIAPGWKVGGTIARMVIEHNGVRYH